VDCNRCQLTRWGKRENGKQRWRCRVCGKTRIRQRLSRPYALLKRYLIYGQTLSQLARLYRVHPLTIRYRLGKILAQPPPVSPAVDLPSPCWLVTDATHFKRWGCLLVTQAAGVRQPLAVSFHNREDYPSVVNHLQPLSGLSVNGYTTDGGRGLVLAYRQLFPDAKHQRCLVHIRMRVQSLLTNRPKLPLGQDLLALTQLLGWVKDATAATDWWALFAAWHNQHQAQINVRSWSIDDQGRRHWWYTHKNLRLAVRHILNAADNLFVFINYPHALSHTNHLEGLFGQRKPALYRHRGLSRSRIANVLLWTFYYLSKTA
jgi:hypothetical protein